VQGGWCRMWMRMNGHRMLHAASAFLTALHPSSPRSFKPSVTNILALCLAGAAMIAAEGSKSPDYGIPNLYQGLCVWAFVWAGLDAFGIGANDGERPTQSSMIDASHHIQPVGGQVGVEG
jgi:hypothetical protein